MGLFNRLKKAAVTVVEDSLNPREHRLADQNMAAAGDPPSAGALADAAAQTPAVAGASFPDAADATWSVDRTWISEGYALVSAWPSVDVGHERVAFAYSCQGDQAFPVGTYASSDRGWVLLWSAGPMPQHLDDTTLPNRDA